MSFLEINPECQGPAVSQLTYSVIRVVLENEPNADSFTCNLLKLFTSIIASDMQRADTHTEKRPGLL